MDITVHCCGVLAARGFNMKQEAIKAISGKYGEFLSPFVCMMEKELIANQDKGDRFGWLQMTKDQAMLEIYYHTAKLQKAVRDNNPDLISEYAADVANMSMMLLDVCEILVDEV